ncbi:MAG: hypothetical protein WCK98_02620 [bacterium]
MNSNFSTSTEINGRGQQLPTVHAETGISPRDKILSALGVKSLNALSDNQLLQLRLTLSQLYEETNDTITANEKEKSPEIKPPEVINSVQSLKEYILKRSSDSTERPNINVSISTEVVREFIADPQSASYASALRKTLPQGNRFWGNFSPGLPCNFLDQNARSGVGGGQVLLVDTSGNALVCVTGSVNIRGDQKPVIVTPDEKKQADNIVDQLNSRS